jgi:hypothetical protein
MALTMTLVPERFGSAPYRAIENDADFAGASSVDLPVGGLPLIPDRRAAGACRGGEVARVLGNTVRCWRTPGTENLHHLTRLLWPSLGPERCRGGLCRRAVND